MPDPTVIRVIDEYRQALLERESAQFADMARQWMQVERALDDTIAALSLEVDKMRSAGEAIPASRVQQLGRYQSLLNQARGEIRRYAEYADSLIAGEQVRYGNDGVSLARAVLDSMYGEAGSAYAAFDLLPIEAIEAMAGLGGDGSPLRDLLMRSWPDAVDGLMRNLLDAIAKGQNPRVTARRMKDGLAAGLDRMLRIARTEQLRAYREATRQQYIRSGVVRGYRRIAAKQSRTCLACLFADGREYALEESFSDHPNGRCALVPIVDGMPRVNWKTGQSWFNNLSEDEQRNMMGGKMFDAWKAGRIGLNDIVRTHTDETWGASLRPATLKELGL